MSPGKLDLLSCVCLPAWSLSTFPAQLSLLSLRTSAGSTASPGRCDPKLTPFLRWLAWMFPSVSVLGVTMKPECASQFQRGKGCCLSFCFVCYLKPEHTTSPFDPFFPLPASKACVHTFLFPPALSFCIAVSFGLLTFGGSITIRLKMLKCLCSFFFLSSFFKKG